MTDCRANCPIPNGGFCERHGVKKSRPWVQLCITNPKYWKAWESGAGPGRINPTPTVTKHGPGYELKKILGWFGIKPVGKCKCNKRAKMMDKWGPATCREKIETIVDWLQEEAGQRGLPFLRIAAKTTVLLAILRAERNTS